MDQLKPTTPWLLFSAYLRLGCFIVLRCHFQLRSLISASLAHHFWGDSSKRKKLGDAADPATQVFSSSAFEFLHSQFQQRAYLPTCVISVLPTFRPASLYCSCSRSFAKSTRFHCWTGHSNSSGCAGIQLQIKSNKFVDTCELRQGSKQALCAGLSTTEKPSLLRGLRKVSIVSTTEVNEARRCTYFRSYATIRDVSVYVY
jgi:hypothetical protein